MRMLIAAALACLAASCAQEKPAEAAFLSAPASAPTLQVEALVITDDIITARIRNSGQMADRLIGASSPFARRIDLREARIRADGALETFVIASGVPLPPASTITLSLAGPHLKATGLAAPLEAGARAPVILVFERSGAVQFEAVASGAP